MLDFWGSSKIALRPKGKWVPEKTCFFVKIYLHIREPFQMKNLILCKKHHIIGSQNSHNITFFDRFGDYQIHVMSV